MESYICTTCGTQFAPTESEPKQCPICRDNRQYVNPAGQQWSTFDKVKKSHRVVFEKKEDHLYGIGTTPQVGIGQRALLIQTPAGNILWDCISLIDEATIDIINSLGGIDAIAISHPHYYSSMIEWSSAFGNAPIYLHEKDQEWVQYPHKNIRFWDRTKQQLFEGISLYNVGGHFDGGTVLHWPEGANGKGALLTGDILQVVPDLKHVSFMYSYPNQIPLSQRAIQDITAILEPVGYDRIYGAWWDRNILSSAKDAVDISAKRYIKAIG
ncbi:MAG TPA: hypothetical protein VJ964_17510 [Balneolaceae bacterium]|nr:hypothetical protein [Balneolaceae bacterium]